MKSELKQNIKTLNMTGFVTLLERETYRFIRLFSQTVIPPVMTTVLFILVFGYSLGSTIREINGHPYIVYIIPGLIQMSVISNAYANSSTSLFVAKIERSIENILVAPLHYLQTVLALTIGGTLRGVTVGFAVLGVSAILVHVPMQNILVMLVSLILTSSFFSAMGIISAVLCESWDQVSLLSTFVITPFTYLGGTFYSIHMLPEFWQRVSHLNPVFYCIDSIRYAMLGVSDVSVLQSLLILLGLNVITIMICAELFRRGYKLIH